MSLITKSDIKLNADNTQSSVVYEYKDIQILLSGNAAKIAVTQFNRKQYKQLVSDIETVVHQHQDNLNSTQGIKDMVEALDILIVKYENKARFSQ